MMRPVARDAVLAAHADITESDIRTGSRCLVPLVGLSADRFKAEHVRAYRFQDVIEAHLDAHVGDAIVVLDVVENEHLYIDELKGIMSEEYARCGLYPTISIEMR